MYKICYVHSSSREILVMKILKDVKDAGNATTQKAVHKANETVASPCTTAALQQPFKQGQCRALRLAKNNQLHKQNLVKD